MRRYYASIRLYNVFIAKIVNILFKVCLSKILFNIELYLRNCLYIDFGKEIFIKTGAMFTYHTNLVHLNVSFVHLCN